MKLESVNLKTLLFLIFRLNLFIALLQIIAIHFTDKAMDLQSVLKIQKSLSVKKLQIQILDQCIFSLIRHWLLDLQTQFFSLKLIKIPENGLNITKFKK